MTKREAYAEATENYLEAILMLSRQRGSVRAADICAHMGFSRPTVSVALKQMREKGLVLVDDDYQITLTEEGREVAVSTYERHKVISFFLLHIGVSEKVAYEDACKIEHDLSEESFEKLKAYCEYLF